MGNFWWYRDSFVLGRAANLYCFSSKSEITLFRIASVRVMWLFSQYFNNLLCNSSSNLTLTSIFLGLSTFGLPVRGLIFIHLYFLRSTNSFYYLCSKKSSPKCTISLYLLKNQSATFVAQLKKSIAVFSLFFYICICVFAPKLNKWNFCTRWKINRRHLSLVKSDGSILRSPILSVLFHSFSKEISKSNFGFS